MTVSAVSRLPRSFIFVAFFNFSIGAILGGLMAIRPSLTYHLAPVHAILNPYGWLTILIYGMTFAVLSQSLGIQLPTRWQGFAQLVLAELGILLLTVGAISSSLAVSRFGVITLIITPLLFLVNILSGVRYTKRLAQGAPQIEDATVVRLFGRFAAYRETDAVGQRGTDVSLMLFIIAAIWAAIGDWNGFPSAGLGHTPALDWLLYYGWIGGTTTSVALHLAPRFLMRRISPAWWWTCLQIAWFLGVLLGMVGNWLPEPWSHLGPILVGLALVGNSVPYVWMALSPKTSEGGGKRPLHGVGTVAWVISWLFALSLGTRLISGVDAFSLSSIHFLFLGFITTLVYAVGYTAFPLVLGKSAPHPSVSITQLLLGVVGSVLLIGSFMQFDVGRAPSGPILAIGGSLATIGVLMFLLSWMFAAKRP